MTNKPLMDKKKADETVRESPYTYASKVDDLRTKIFWGRDIHTYEPKYGDPTYWIYEKGVEKQIKDDYQYKVWYTWRDAADPADSTTWYRVWYIEEISPAKTAMIAAAQEFLNNI